MDKCFNSKVCSILKVAEKEMIDCHHPYVGTEHLLLSLLKNPKISNFCYKFNLTYKGFKDELLKIIGKANKKSEIILYTPLLRIVIDKAYNKSYDDNKDMDEFYLLSSLLNEQDGIALRIASNMGIDLDAMVKEINKPNLVYELGINLNEKKNDGVYLREKEISKIMQILLRKNKNNPILIGQAGVGKTAVVEELACRLKNGNVPDKLKGYEIFLINMSALIAGTKYRGEFESRVNNLVKEVIKCKNIILFIDEIHTLIKTGASDGSIDAANILKPYLARGDIKVIGATTTEEYDEYIKKDPALVRRFTPVIVNEPNLNDMVYIMQKIKKNYEKYYGLKISDSVIKYLIDNTNKYLPHLYNPDKSIEVLDTVCAKKVLDGNDFVLSKNDVYNSLCERINLINIDNVKLKNVYLELKSNYDEKCLENIVNVIKNRELKKWVMIDQNKEINLSLIKTISKKLNVNLIMIDCKEYNDDYSISKLINGNYLYNKLDTNPFSFIVFNNYNEANKVLYNIINTMVNNGYITNMKNEKFYLNNSLIFIMQNKKEQKIGFNNLLITS